MPNPSELSNSRAVEQASTREIFRGVIATDATLPSDRVFVTIPEFDEEDGEIYRHGPCSWNTQIFEGSEWYPKRGDSCVVGFPGGDTTENNDDPWILAWEVAGNRPSDYEPS